MTLPALEFIRRFLQPVWPEGFHKVRYYGLWSPVHQSLLHQLQLWLARHDPVPPPASPAPESQAPASWGPPLRAGQPCPSGGQGLLVVIRLLPRLQRGPP
jgi:Putative transposase